jgi:hypothetical protein
MMKVKSVRPYSELSTEEVIRTSANLAKDYLSHCILEGIPITANNIEKYILTHYNLDPKPRKLTPIKTLR